MRNSLMWLSKNYSDNLLINKFSQYDGKSNFKKAFNKVIDYSKYIFYGNTPAGHILRIYVYVVIIGTILLMTPVAVKNDSWHFTNALFLACSSFSDTGLSLKVLASDYTLFGQIITLILIQIGGLGLLTIKVLLLLLIMKKITYTDRKVIQIERGSTKIGGTVNLIKNAGIFIFSLEAIVTCIFWIYFSLSSDPVAIGPSFQTHLYHNVGWSFWVSCFHTISSVNNAGFDILGSHSLLAYQHKYFVQILTIVCFVIGGIGFPIFTEIGDKIKSFIKHESYSFSLFTKVCITYFFIVAGISVGLVCLVEYLPGVEHKQLYANPNINLPYLHGYNKFMAIVFNTMSARNAGFSTVNINSFSSPSIGIISLSMFVGSSPASTGGGVRTTTIAALIFGLITLIKTRKAPSLFKKQLSKDTVMRAFLVVFMAFILVSVVAFVIVIESKQNILVINAFFEACSAFGTTGLSTLKYGESQLGYVSQYLLIILMFIGQYGVSNTVFSRFSFSKNSATFTYPLDDLVIG